MGTQLMLVLRAASHSKSGHEVSVAPHLDLEALREGLAVQLRLRTHVDGRRLRELEHPRMRGPLRRQALAAAMVWARPYDHAVRCREGRRPRVTDAAQPVCAREPLGRAHSASGALEAAPLEESHLVHCCGCCSVAAVLRGRQRECELKLSSQRTRCRHLGRITLPRNQPPHIQKERCATREQRACAPKPLRAHAAAAKRRRRDAEREGSVS